MDRNHRFLYFSQASESQNIENKVSLFRLIPNTNNNPDNDTAQSSKML